MTAFPEERFPSPGGRIGPSLFRERAFVDRPLTMRGVTEDDLPELIRVDHEAFPDDPYPHFVLRQLFDLHGDCLLVLDDGRSLHGYVLYVTTRDGYRSWVVSLGVTRDQRGRGLGRRLMLEVLRRLRADDVREVRLTVEPANAAAIMLYRSLGFSSDEGVRKDYFGAGEDRLVMTLGL
ncbi:GNAT family N-acetyltransferase [Streptomyces sp. NPDC005708]|uniref:GNAT family N-acetyltransferase n=1 Tax=unclassified Streptomyces TaxID=2593676 RepID=UPI0033FE8ABE